MVFNSDSLRYGRLDIRTNVVNKIYPTGTTITNAQLTPIFTPPIFALENGDPNQRDMLTVNFSSFQLDKNYVICIHDHHYQKWQTFDIVWDGKEFSKQLYPNDYQKITIKPDSNSIEMYGFSGSGYYLAICEPAEHIDGFSKIIVEPIEGTFVIDANNLEFNTEYDIANYAKLIINQAS